MLKVQDKCQTIWNFGKKKSEISNFTVSWSSKYIVYVINKLTIETINILEKKIILKKILKKFDVMEIQFLDKEEGILVVQESCRNLKIIYFDEKKTAIQIKLPYAIQYLDKFFFPQDNQLLYLYQNDQFRILDKNSQKSLFTLKFNGEFRIIRSQNNFFLSGNNNKIERYYLNKVFCKKESSFFIKDKIQNFEISKNIIVFHTQEDKQKILICDFQHKKLIRKVILPIFVFIHEIKFSNSNNYLYINSGIQLIQLRIATNQQKQIILQEKLMDQMQITENNQIFYISEKLRIKKILI